MRPSNFVPLPVMRATVRLAVPRILSPAVPVRSQRRLLDVIGRCLQVKPGGTTVVRTTLGGRPCERIVVDGADPGRAVLYLHGGAYTVGGAGTHRALAAHLAAASAATVYLLDYRLAPEDPYPAALEDAVAAHRELQGLAEVVSVGGDSAGGGLALALMTRLRDAVDPLPVAAALISPWVDLTLGNVRDDPRDPMLRRAWLRSSADAYAGGADVAAPELSPLFADLAGLPPMAVQGSGDEILVGDVERLVDALRSAGVDVDYQRLEGLWHVAHLQAGLVGASTRAVNALGGFLSAAMEQHLAPPQSRT